MMWLDNPSLISLSVPKIGVLQLLAGIDRHNVEFEVDTGSKITLVIVCIDLDRGGFITHFIVYTGTCSTEPRS